MSFQLDMQKSTKVYFQTFKEEYHTEFPCMRRSTTKGTKYAFCDVCRNDFSIAHGGRNDIFRHVNGPKHKENVKCTESNSKVSSFFRTPDNLQADTTRAELLFTSFLIEHNVPLSAASHAGPLFRKMFPKDEIAKRYGCGKTKTAAIVHEMAEDRTFNLVKVLKEIPFSVACDGSHESDYKLYPVVVTYFNSELGVIESTLLAIPNLSGNSTGENIGSLILNVFEKLSIPIDHCIAFSADNAAVMQGKKNGVIAFLEERQKNIISIGCCCHLIHLASEKAAVTLPEKIDEVLIDIFYYLKKSVNRKESLKRFQDLYGKEAQKIVKHVSTRWLSLGRSLARLVNQWEPLTSFFKEEIESKSYSVSTSLSLYKIPKFMNKKEEESDSTVTKGNKGEKQIKRDISSSSKQDKKVPKRKSTCPEVLPLKKHKAEHTKSVVLTKEEKIFMFLTLDLNKAYSLFLLGVIPVFERINTILQSASPQIYRLRELLQDLLKELYSKFVKPAHVKGKDLTKVNFHCSSCHKDNKDLVISNAASHIILKHSEEEQKAFYANVIKFFVTACEYVIRKFPLNDDVLKHAEVANLKNIEESSFSSIRYFVDLFPFILERKNNESKDEALDQLEQEFCQLQLEDISSIISAHERIDVQWAQIKKMSGLKYERLAKVVLSILVIPHSNAECERIFSLVRKSRTESRSLMSNKTLESLLILKTQNSSSCFEQVFHEDFLKKAKKATAAALNSSATSSQA